MKISYLNTWNGHEKNAYLSFISERSNTDDVICLQEINNSKEQKIDASGALHHQWELTENICKDFIGFHATRQYDWHDSPSPTPWGLGIFVRKTIPILEYREKFLIGHMNSASDTGFSGQLPVVIHAVKVLYTNTPIWIVNFHGYYAGVGIGKNDTPQRMEQSKKILDFLSELGAPIILGGDFNLDIHTESLRIIEKSGLKNLIKKYNVLTTRTSFYPAEKRMQWPHADYLFVSQDIHVTHFTVDSESIASDHAPMYLEIQ